jgi:hypothetical protein
MNLFQLKEKLVKACDVLESADLDLSSIKVEFDINIQQIDSFGLVNEVNEVTKISYNLLDDGGTVKITIE